jgi:hypothetical protein
MIGPCPLSFEEARLLALYRRHDEAERRLVMRLLRFLDQPPPSEVAAQDPCLNSNVVAFPRGSK